MNPNNQNIPFYLAGISRILLVVIICLCAKSLVGQNHIRFKEKSEKEVFDKLANTLSLDFNYDNSLLKEKVHSFSVSGDILDILNQVEQKLHIHILPLENNIYALTKKDASPIESPTYSFTIKNTDDETLPFCNIHFPALDLLFQADIDGRCTVKGFFSEEEEMNISFIGYATRTIKMRAIKNGGLIVLDNANHILGEIIIRDFLSTHRTNRLENQETLHDIDIAGVSDQDLLQKAQLLPGIHSTSESLNDLQIRGGPPDQVSYKWNNIRLLQTSLFYGKVSGVNPFMVDDIHITRNGSSADQSGQASGSILLKSSVKANNDFKVRIFSDLIYGNIGLQLPIIKDKLSAKIAYRKSHNYLFNSSVYNNYFDQSFQFGQLENDQFYIDFFGIRGQEQIERRFSFDDLSFLMNYNISDKTEISASLLSIRNRFEYSYFDGFFDDATKKDDLQISNIGWSITAKHRFSSKLHLNALYTGSRYRNHYLFSKDIGKKLGRDQFRENDVDQEQYSIDLNYSHKWIDVKLGVQQEEWDVLFLDTTRVRAQGLINVINGASTNEQSAFLRGQWKFIPRTLIETGIRYSDFGFSLVDRKFIEPRIHISHTLNSKLTLHAHYGKFHQNLNRRLFTSVLEVEKGIWYLSDERPESDNFIWVVQNEQTSIGLKYMFDRWKLTVDAYTKKAENIWTSALDFAVEEDPFAFADLSVRGLEFSSHFQNKHWRCIWTYELTDENLEVKQKEEFEIKSPFTQRHKLSFMQSFNKKDWTVSSRWKYNSGRYFSVGREFITITEPSLYYGIEYDNLLRETVAPYHNLDLSLLYKWQYGNEKKRWVEFGLHIQNVYNRTNVIKRQYYIDYTKTPFELAFYDRQGIGFTPNFSIRMQL